MPCLVAFVHHLYVIKIAMVVFPFTPFSTGWCWTDVVVGKVEFALKRRHVRSKTIHTVTKHLLALTSMISVDF